MISLPVYASFEWHELAIPFGVAAAGRIVQIDTAVFYSFGDTPLVVGIATGNLVGTSSLNSVFADNLQHHYSFSGRNQFRQQSTGGQSVALAPGEFFSWTGQLFLDAGDYWLYASAGTVSFLTYLFCSQRRMIPAHDQAWPIWNIEGISFPFLLSTQPPMTVIIHLKDAKFYQPGGALIPTNKRFRLDCIFLQKINWRTAPYGAVLDN